MWEPSAAMFRSPRWLVPFAVVALLAQLSALVPGHLDSLAAYATSCAVLAIVLGAAASLPWWRLSLWGQMLIPLGYVVSLGFLLHSLDSSSAGLQVMALLPVIWAALLARPRQSVVILIATVAMILAASVLADNPEIAIARRGVFWALVGGLLIVAAYNLRRWLDDAVTEREEALQQAEALGVVAAELNASLDPEMVIATALRCAAEITSRKAIGERSTSYLRLHEGSAVTYAQYDGAGSQLMLRWPIGEHPHLQEAIRTVAPTRGPLELERLGPTLRELVHASGARYGAWAPVLVGGRVHGVLEISERTRPVSDAELGLCAAIARMLGRSLENAVAHQLASRAALTDPLTGAANRRALEEYVDRHSRRHALTILLIDVDGLKAVNDRDGHQAGDQLLQAVASTAATVLRPGDVLARVGGDEFAAAILDADQEVAQAVAQRLLDALRGLATRQPIGASIGIAAGRPGGDLKALLAAADSAMYQSKRAGGTRYSVAGGYLEPAVA